MLLMYRFCTLNTPVQGHYILQQLIPLSLLRKARPCNMNINENVQTHVDCGMVTKYSAIHFINLNEYFTEFMQ